MSKEQTFKEIVATMHEIYDKQLSSVAQKIWWNALKPYSSSQISQAMSDHLTDVDSGKFAPKPADLIAKINGTTKQIEVSIEAKAIAAWDEAYKAMMKSGQYQSITLNDPMGMKVIQHLGGWPSFCMMRQDEGQWRRKEFIAAYKTLQGSENLPAMLTGVGEKSAEKIEGQKSLNRIYQKAGEQQ